LTNLRYPKKSANIITHPNDLYIRVAPDGPYDRANQGWQKENFMSTMGFNRQTQLYGEEFDDTNPMNSTRNYRPNGNMQMNGFAPVGDGPAMFTDDGDEDTDVNNPSLLSTIF